MRLWFEAVDVELTGNAGRTVGTARIVATSPHVDSSVGNGWDREFDRIARRVRRGQGTIPQLGRYVGGIICVEHHRSAP